MSETIDGQESAAVAPGAADLIAAARAHRREGRPAEAVRLLESLVTREPGNAVAFEELAAAFCDLNHHRPAAWAARRALELDPSLYRPHGVLSWIALKEGRNGEAEEELRAQLAALPADDPSSHVAAHCRLGLIYLRQRRYEEAEQAWQEALSFDPAAALPHFNLAMLALATKRHDEARTRLEQLLSLPEVPDKLAHAGHVHLGQLYARQGRYAEARRQFGHAVQVRRSFQGQLYRAMPLLARYPGYILWIILLIAALIVWNLLTRL